MSFEKCGFKKMSDAFPHSFLRQNTCYTWAAKPTKPHRICFPKPELLLKIAETLDVDIRELFHPTKESSATLEDIQKAIDILERLKKDLE